MAYFDTLSELGDYAANTGASIEVVDPPTTLTEWTDKLAYGPAWDNQPSVRKVVGFIARQLASTPLHLFERSPNNDRERVRVGALAELLRRPSRAPGVTPYRFWESLLIDGLLHDKWVARINEHNDGYSLTRIPAVRVRFKSDWLGQIEKIRITNDKGETQEEDPAGYLIDVGYSTRGANGTSPLKTLRDILDEYSEAIAYRREVMQNGARIPQVIERPHEAGKFEEGAFTRFKQSWQAFLKGGGKAGGTPILEDGMKLKEVNSFRPRDTEDLEGRRLTDIEVCSSYYIAPELVGARPGTFANVKAFKEMLFGPNLGPYYDAWQQVLNNGLVPLIEPSRDVYIEASIEAKMRGSFEEQIDYLSTAVGAPIMTRNEARPRLNLPQVDGGDELVTPLNVLIGGQASPQSGKSMDVVVREFQHRQIQVARSQKNAGVHDWWDRARWDRELADDLVAAGAEPDRAKALARLINDKTERMLTTEGTSGADEDG
ncbi:phage portal protein [Microbacterium sp. PAMC21962]|uniref:phage portal protein n=1 Tax=Microbacterium sp. PAMC21962 TaxID=2861280 RepID=UPI001C62BC95|nr:phage portal protein [Microbacterium sp. PAMC21962]QYF98916.1 phage portal protein [Microbacterium sp. PAMC21962]